MDTIATRYRGTITGITTAISWLLVLILISGCSLFSSPPVDQYMEDEQIDYYSYMDIAPLREVEDRLTTAYQKQVDWDEYDGETLKVAMSAIKSEFSWLKMKVVRGDKIMYYDAKVANDKVNFFWMQARKILDDISIDGAVDEDTTLIYHFVRKEITRNLGMWNASMEKAEANINNRIERYDMDKARQFVDSIEPLIGKLPFM